VNKQEVIGIDLGGTAIKLGTFLQDGTCTQSLTIPTPQPATPEEVVTAIATTVKQLNAEGNCVAMGLGTPGPVDASGRIAKVAINLMGWQDVPLADWLEKETGLATTLANDANCAGLGEAWLGAARRFPNSILLTLGTGVGGAIILDGKLFIGHQGAAGELGLITLNPDGPSCNSGNQGSLEQYTSVQAIRRVTGKEPAQLAQLAEAGDEEALTFWREYGRLLGIGLTSLIYVLTPEAIIIGGGVSGAAEFFFPATMAEIQSRVLPSSRLGLELLTAELGNQAGIIGAAKLAWDFMFMVHGS
jgi:glucokinase